MSGLRLIFKGMPPESVLFAKKMHANVEFGIDPVGIVPFKKLLDNCQYDSAGVDPIIIPRHPN